MVYYAQGMELEVVSEAFRGPVNDVLICRDRLSASGTRYTLLAVHDRVCARNLLAVLENSEAAGESPCLLRFSQNETLLFAFLYREERKFSAFARGQAATPGLGESICVNLVMECLSAGLPWPLLYLVLRQDGVQIAKDNTVYFTLLLDLAELDPERSETAAEAAEKLRADSPQKREKCLQRFSRAVSGHQGNGSAGEENVPENQGGGFLAGPPGRPVPLAAGAVHGTGAGGGGSAGFQPAVWRNSAAAAVPAPL